MNDVFGQGSQAGTSFVSVIMTLLILGVMYFGYFHMQRQMGSEEGVGTHAIEASRSVACRSQRQAFDREIQFWRTQHPDEPLSLRAMADTGVHIPSCPEGGSYDIAGRHLECSMHD